MIEGKQVQKLIRQRLVVSIASQIGEVLSLLRSSTLFRSLAGVIFEPIAIEKLLRSEEEKTLQEMRAIQDTPQRLELHPHGKRKLIKTPNSPESLEADRDQDLREDVVYLPVSNILPAVDCLCLSGGQLYIFSIAMAKKHDFILNYQTIYHTFPAAEQLPLEFWNFVFLTPDGHVPEISNACFNKNGIFKPVETWLLDGGPQGLPLFYPILPPKGQNPTFAKINFCNFYNFHNLTKRHAPHCQYFKSRGFLL